MSLFQVLFLSFLIHFEMFGSSLLLHRSNENCSAANSQRRRNLSANMFAFPWATKQNPSIPKHPLGRRKKKKKMRSFTS